MLECDVCESPLEEEDAILGYTAPNCVLCVSCYEYLDNEIFAYKPGEDDA